MRGQGNEFFGTFATNSFGHNAVLIIISIILTIILLVIYYFFIGVSKGFGEAMKENNFEFRNGTNFSAGKGNKTNKGNIVSGVDVDKEVIKVAYTRTAHHNSLEGMVTSTGHDAQVLAQSIQTFMDNTGQAKQLSGIQQSFNIGGNQYHVDGKTLEVILRGADGYAFTVSINEIENIRSERDIIRLLDDNFILSYSTVKGYK